MLSAVRQLGSFCHTLLPWVQLRALATGNSRADDEQSPILTDTFCLMVGATLLASPCFVLQRVVDNRLIAHGGILIAADTALANVQPYHFVQALRE